MGEGDGRSSPARRGGSGCAAREGMRGRGVRTFGDLEPGGHGGRELAGSPLVAQCDGERAR